MKMKMKMKNNIAKFYEKIARKMNLIVYVIIFVLMFFIFSSLLSMRLTNSTNIAKESLNLVKMTISSIATAAVDQTSILRDVAQSNINQPVSLVPHELYLSLTANKKEEIYALHTLPPKYDKELASYILGGGEIPVNSSEKGQEIEAALKLNSIFADIKRNIPQATWIYYYSSNRFINMYPFENQADIFPWSDAYLVHPLFLRAQPKQDPTREVQWFKAYIDEAGKGLMTSIVAPVYDKKDQFRSMVGMDFTLQMMNRYLTGTGLDIGTPLLINQQGQVLAHPSQVRSNDKTVKQLRQVLPAELKDASSKILKLKAGQYHDISGWKIYILDIHKAPWRVLFLINQKQFFWHTIARMQAEIFGILMLMLIIGVLEQRRRIAQRLRTYKAAVDSSSAAIIIIDRHRKIQYINKRFIEMTGYSEAEVIGLRAGILESEETPAEVYSNLWDALEANKSWQGELLNRKKDGKLYWVNILISPVNGNKHNGCYVAVLEDITERKGMLEELNKLATTDVLTNISNRRHFLSIAESEFKRANRYNKYLSVMMLDLDLFKHVNDTFGHATGDLVLQKFTAKCSELIRKEDSMGRLGGEEFAFLLPEIDLNGALKAAERIRQATELLETTTAEGETVKITCSIGVAQKEENEEAFHLLLSRADKALHEAKNGGRNSVRVDGKTQNK